jgi:serine protease Do
MYGLPTAELEKVLLNWLYQSGFNVQRTQLRSGIVRLSLTRPAEKWQLILKTHSALATEVQSILLDKADRKSITYQKMAGHISAYIQGGAPKKESTNQLIPSAVLSQIGAVVCVRSKSKDTTTQHSGLIVDTAGLILSTIHDVEDFRDIKINLYNGHELRGEFVKKDFDRDLALIDIRSGLDSSISLAKGRNLLGMGERVYSIGCPVNLVGTVFPGLINGPPRRVDQQTYWQVNMEIHPGSSGSPVFDARGKLVGIVKGRYRGSHSIGFLIPLETMIAFVKER